VFERRRLALDCKVACTADLEEAAVVVHVYAHVRYDVGYPLRCPGNYKDAECDDGCMYLFLYS
jgi:hypothetical protein